MRRLLVVDDDDDLREALCELLAFGGYEVAGAEGGAQALAWLREKGPPDLILLDLMMPAMSGAELKARLDTEPALAQIPILVLSGDTRLREQAAAIGAVGWLSKPASMETLLHVVARHVDGAPSRREGVDGHPHRRWK